MVEVKDCWLKDTCLRYGNCESFCMKLFKLDQLYEKALVPLNLRKHVNLRPDGNGTDREEFKQLKSFTDNIEEFVNSGKCLYIHSNTTGNGKHLGHLGLLKRILMRYGGDRILSAEHCISVYLGSY